MILWEVNRGIMQAGQTGYMEITIQPRVTLAIWSGNPDNRSD